MEREVGPERIEVPRAWEQLDVDSLRGCVLVIGGPDVGKTTFARYLYRRLRANGQRAAYLDGDPGQSTMGPPTTMTLGLGDVGNEPFSPLGQSWRRFVGSVSPRGHMLPLVVGAWRLVLAARQAGARTVVYDTSGLVDPGQGGLALKLAKVNLLRPTAVFAIQRGRELESLLVPLRRSQRVRVIDLRPAPAAQRRDVLTRRQHRAAQFARYFGQGGGTAVNERIPSQGGPAAHELTVDWGRLAVFASPRFGLNGLLALEDAEGFALGLGIVLAHDVTTRRVRLCTPLASLEGVDALHLGDVAVDPRTFEDRPLAADRDRWEGPTTS